MDQLAPSDLDWRADGRLGRTAGHSFGVFDSECLALDAREVSALVLA